MGVYWFNFPVHIVCFIKFEILFVQIYFGFDLIFQKLFKTLFTNVQVTRGDSHRSRPQPKLAIKCDIRHKMVVNHHFESVMGPDWWKPGNLLRRICFCQAQPSHSSVKWGWVSLILRQSRPPGHPATHPPTHPEYNYFHKGMVVGVWNFVCTSSYV